MLHSLRLSSPPVEQKPVKQSIGSRSAAAHAVAAPVHVYRLLPYMAVFMPSGVPCASTDMPINLI